MATYKYVIASGCETELMTDHYHSKTVAEINAAAKSNIPSNAVIDSVQVYLKMSTNGGLFTADLYIRFCNNESDKASNCDNLVEASAQRDNDKEYPADITSKVNKKYPFNISTSYSKLAVFYDSTTHRNYRCREFCVKYNYSIPTYTLTVNAGTGGTVSGGGTYEAQKSVTLKATPNTGYKFVKWSDGNTSATRTVTVTGNATYTATFEKLKFTVTWKNGGTVLETDTNVEYGTTPTYNGSTPTKSSTAQYSYTFSGWSPSVGAISGNTTYTAQFTATTRKYTVNFKNQDGSVVKTISNVAYGTALGDLPDVSREGYHFGGWIPCEPAKKTDGTVLDSYKYNGDNAYPLDKKYKYTDKLSVHIEAYMSNWEDIASLKAQIISCTEGGGWGLGYQANSSGHGTELYAGGYKGIDLELGTAGKFSNNTWYSFDIVFSNGTFEAYVNGTKKGTQTTANTAISYNSENTIFVGAEAAESATTPGGNYFKGHISNVFIANKGTRLVAATTSTVVEGNVDYYPVWRLNAYAVTFKDENGTTLKTETVSYGSKPTPPSNPTKADTAQWDYTFDGWYDAIGNKWTSNTTITGATTFTARYTAVVQKYIVRWFNYDGTLLETDTDVPYGTKPTYNGSTPTKAGNAEHSYQFAGWNYDTQNGITPSLGTTYIDITAQFTEIDNTYTVEWVNEGKVIETDTLVPYGAKPDYDEVKNGIPTKASDAQYDYTFIGWSTSVSDPAKPESELETVKGNVTYTAVYSATLKLYPIKIILFDTESTQVVEYGTDIVIEAPAVIGYKFTKWADGNTANPRTVKVTGEATYQAVYERIPFPIIVNEEQQVIGVYIVPTTQTIVYIISGEVPEVVTDGVTVDDWSFRVSNSVPDNSYPIEKLYINETRVY